MQPLIDGDILCYEVGFAAETGWSSHEDRPGFPPFDYVAELLDNRISNICAVVDATSPPILFLTGEGNFRYEIAKRHPYKARPSNKPWHYYNIKAYMGSKYEVVISKGMEADDLMSIEQTSRMGDTIICSRDKDLRSVPGWHYGWELGNQPSFGPEQIDRFGSIYLSKDRKSIRGGGEIFFYSQCLTGDKVDTVPGLPGCGAVKAFEILEGSRTSNEALKRVYGAYKAVYGLSAYKELLEQGRLLWMTRKLHPDGSPVLWGQNG